MNKTITEFYTSEDKDKEYIKNYDIEHGPRLDAIIETFNLKELKNLSILDIGGGMGFLEKRLDESNRFLIIDGAELPHEKKVAKFVQLKQDINIPFAHNCEVTCDTTKGTAYELNYKFDASFCFEVIEHLENPYRCLLEMKEATKENGYIYVSVPDISVTHVTPYPGLIYPVDNFIIFLQQLALIVEDYFLFDKGWKTHIIKCRNAKMEDAIYVPIFKKNEPKFIGRTPIEIANL